MSKAELLKRFNYLRKLVDAVAGLIAIFSLLGCFSELHFIRTLALAVLFSMVSILVNNMVLVSLYTKIVLRTIESEIARQRHLLSLSEQEVSNLNRQICEWQGSYQQKQKEVEQLKLQLLESQRKLLNAQTQITSSNHQRDLLQAKFDALQEQFRWLRSLRAI